VVPVLSEVAAERRMYLPLAVPIALAVLGCYSLLEVVLQKSVAFQRNRQSIPYSAAGLAVPVITIGLVFAVVSWNRLAAYENELDLWQEVIKYQPENQLAHQNFGCFLDRAGRTQEAMDQLREAIRLNPNSGHAHYNLGLVLFRTRSY